MVRAFIPSSILTEADPRVLFGVGSSPSDVTAGGQSAYIGVEDYDLVGYTYDGTSTKKITFSNFIDNYTDSIDLSSILTMNETNGWLMIRNVKVDIVR